MTHNRAAAAMIAASLAALVAIQFLYPPAPTPRLIGHGCANSGGDLWAMEESDFPECEMIERNL